ncbi:MAG: U32 family peptidase, partial [Oscillospiraceae bacterium]|nr:U32 family peptidase [Oscillospiraceae bacterium]
MAPAGGPESVIAAVRAGADAVYLGGGYSARQYAVNFTDQEMAEAISYCHRAGARVYIALNTLIRDGELDSALAAAAHACEIGADGLIVQDLGLARCLRAMAPEMTLHASTQTSCHTPAMVKTMAEMGFSRVVLAREMTLEEIAACAGLGVELEVFVHGALCMSVSGQCYLSAVLGGRSGNRGRCAGPCRLPWLDSKHNADEQYALSLKDLCAAGQVAALAAIGVTSLKIEGRMKRPEYVAAAAAVYRDAADRLYEHPQPEGLALTPLKAGNQVKRTTPIGVVVPKGRGLTNLKSVFSRSGFTDGYLTGRRGPAMFGWRRHEDVLSADPVLKKLRAGYQQEQPRVDIHMLFNWDGSTATLTVRDNDGNTAAEQITSEAKTPPLAPERTAEAVRKT